MRDEGPKGDREGIGWEGAGPSALMSSCDYTQINRQNSCALHSPTEACLIIHGVQSLKGYFSSSNTIFNPFPPQERVGRPTEGQQIGIVDPDGSVIALHIYCGMVKIVPLELDSTEPLTAFNIRSL